MPHRTRLKAGKLESKILNWKIDLEIEKLSLPKVNPSKRKFIVIQIDALSYDLLKKFLGTKYCKFISRLLKNKNYHLTNYNCGIPSDTPTVTAGIMYGLSKEVAGFRTIDKKNRKILDFSDPSLAYETEKILNSKSKGILKDGSCSALFYSGGSKRSFLTMSTFMHKNNLNRIKESSVLLIMLLNPFILVKSVFRSVTEFILEFYDSLQSFIHRTFIVKEKKARFRILYPFKRFFYQGFLMELQKIIALIDMRSGVSRIYINLQSYDDILHRRGASSNAALRILRQIDGTIGKIYKATPEDYDFFILSDHGAEDSIPFNSAFDENLSDLLNRLAKVPVGEKKEESTGKLRLHYASKFLASSLNILTWPLKIIGKIILKIVSKKFRVHEHNKNWTDKYKIFVRNGGGIAQVYFNIKNERLQLSDIMTEFPNVIDGLRKHPGIGFFMVKEKGKLLVYYWDGMIKIDQKTAKVVYSTGNFLKKYGNPKVLIKQLVSFSKRKNVGDLVLFGAHYQGKSISFGDYYSTHGGVGKVMCNPFFISKKKYDFSGNINADCLYDVFKKYL